ncbi:rhomboid family intramembrane serine protease [Halovivax gelatinilyticus]|uniref:rhomboid family intramembrane serine protease n=1 Tax=Halovivax gelatinilyticus TaxID=2961597 RepID=UPI0020CA6F88|nr:rhomboid family intramembrane serine protease [Halovivax gelatinilyticus]
MAKCDVCGAAVSMPYNCRHCGGTHCSQHRLPENHSCSGLHQWNDPKGVFDSGFDSSADNAETSSTDRILAKLPIDTGPGGPLAYFRGNVTYTILLFMWVTFLLQQVASLGLAPRGSLEMYPSAYETYRSIFVLTPQNPEYAWTWVTSIFAHGGLIHIAFNSIVIFFFGPLLARYLRDRQFWALFLGAGILAGLAQIMIQISEGGYGLLGGGVVGASGGALAILGVITVLHPQLRVYFMFFIPMPLWILTVGFAAISLLLVGGGGAGAGGIAHAAHLVGLVVGFAVGEYIKRTQNVRGPNQFQLGPGGPGGPGGGRGPF